ncbi:MAG: carboxypeptidase-like regulatory domain-containing protein [Flavobacteriales bacterium]|nr:carboxypeptidase-like regulatory domain-containing protein [Flavobacteriales bacterium]
MKISISVPEPCHENWNAMIERPTAEKGIEGRHCASCQHTVMDLTRVSDAQLIALFLKDAMPKCARFDQNQLDRVIALETDRTPRLLPTAAVGMALALASPDTNAQNCMPTVGKMLISRPPVETVKGNMIVQTSPPVVVDTIAADSASGVQTGQMVIRGGKAEVIYYIDGVKVSGADDTPIRKEEIEALPIITGGRVGDYGDIGGGLMQHRLITGRVVDDHAEPLPFASVLVGEVGAQTDFDGRFVLSIPASNVGPRTLRVNYVGFRTVEIPLVVTAVVSEVEACIYNDRAALTGRVTGPDGRIVVNCMVEVKELGLRCATDGDGFYSFEVPTGTKAEALTVSARMKNGPNGATAITTDALPCCVPITLHATEQPATVDATDIDLGDVVMGDEELMFLGEMVITRASPTPGSIIAKPFKWIGRQVSKPFR